MDLNGFWPVNYSNRCLRRPARLRRSGGFPLPQRADIRVLAFLAPKAGTGIEDPSRYCLQDLLDEVEKDFVVFVNPSGLGHFDPWLLVLDEVDDLESPGWPTVEPLKGVSVGGELHHRLDVE